MEGRLPATQRLPDLAKNPTVQASQRWLRQQAEAITRLQVRFAQLPSPDLRATPRAALFHQCLAESHLVDIHTDGVGNVLGTLPGSAPAGDRIVVSAHLDSVFPHLEHIEVVQEGNVVRAPGIADDAAGLAAVVFLVRALQRLGQPLTRDVVVVATVGEEGEGDLAGVKHLFRNTWEPHAVAAFLTLDLGSQRHAAHAALGCRRFEVRVHGPGGHSWGDFGRPNPIHALCRGVALFLQDRSAMDGKGSWNIGCIEGGRAVNAIPENACLRVDLRSREQRALEDLERSFRQAMAEAIDREHAAAKPHAGTLTLDMRSIGDRPTGETPLDSPLVLTCAAAFAACGFPLEFTQSSTDANVPMSLAVPALALPHGARAFNAHSEQEWCDVSGREAVLEAELLALLALAGFPASPQ
jgi:acetylornithine deacetylase/succinyl-diaminopimelate desuccinylase-like protein